MRTILFIGIFGVLASPSAGFGQTVTFAPFLSLNTGKESVGVRAADMNNDGLSDLIVFNDPGSYDNEGTFFLYYQDESGQLEVPPLVVPYPGAGPGEGVEIEDMDGNGFKDVVLMASNDIVISYQMSDGVFNPFQIVPGINFYKLCFTVGDFNNDGLKDLAYNKFSSNILGLSFQQPDHTFQHFQFPAPPNVKELEKFKTADMNLDGRDDLVVASSPFTPDSLYIFFQSDSSMVQQIKRQKMATADYALGDVNNDGWKDLVTNEFRVYLYNPDSQIFELHQTLATSHYGTSMDLVDLNCDGYLDLVAAHGQFFPHVKVHQGSSAGFTSYSLFPVGNNEINSRGMAIADFNGDSRLDICLARMINPTEGGKLLLNTTTPALSNFVLAESVVDTVFSMDTLLQQELLVNSALDVSGDCILVSVDSFEVITTTFSNVQVSWEAVYFLEALLCDSLFTDTLFASSSYTLPDWVNKDTILISSFSDTLSLVNNLESFWMTDTLETSIFYDSMLVWRDSSWQAGDTIFTQIDSFFLIGEYENLVTETTWYQINEIQQCGQTFLDTLIDKASHQLITLLDQDTMWISQTLFTFVIVSTSEEWVKESDLILFPNPSDGLVYIMAPEMLQHVGYAIHVMDGSGRDMGIRKIVPPGIGDAVSLDLSSLLPGFYWVRIENQRQNLWVKLFLIN